MRSIVISFSLVLALAGCARSADIAAGTPADWRAALQPPLAADALSSLTAGPSLADAIDLAMRRNPGVAAARREWLAAIHAIPMATTPMDPNLYQLAYDFEMNRWDSLGIEVPLPWYQKLLLGGRIAGAQADVARLRYEATARDLIIDLKDAYYELYYLDQAAPITERVERLLRNEGLLAYGGLASGRTQLNEAFRAESQAAQLAYDRLLLDEQRASQAERLRAMLNLPPQTEIGPLRAAPVYEVTDDLASLHARAEQWSQVLKVRGLEVQRAAYETRLARLARVPDPMTMLRIGNLAGGPNSYMGMLTANLPIYEWRNRALIREKEAMEEAVRRMALDESNQLRAMVAQAYFEVRLTGRLVDLYSQTLLPQADSVLRQAELDFRAELSSFSNVLETTLAWHNFTLAALRARADHGQAIGRLERAIGATADAHPADSSASDSGEGHP